MKTVENLAQSQSFKDKYLGNIIRMAILIALAITCTKEFNFQAYDSILTQIATTGLICSGLAIVMIGGGFDFSLIAISMLCACIAGNMIDGGYDLYSTLAVAGLTGLICGLLNAILCVSLHIKPFIATLISGAVYYSGANLLIGNKATTYLHPANFVKHFNLFNTGTATVGKIGVDIKVAPDTLAMPPVMFLPIALIIAIAIIVCKTKWGLALKASARNASAAKECGLNPNRIRFTAYIIAGFLCSIAAIFIVFKSSYPAVYAPFSATFSTTSILFLIVPVLIGGCSGYGARGSILGTAMGVLIAYFVPPSILDKFDWTLYQCLLALIALVIVNIIKPKKIAQ